MQEPALGLPERRKEACHLGGHTAPRLLLGPFCASRQRNTGLAFHDNFANVLPAVPLASAGKAACLLLAMPGKASEAVVWPLSDCGGSEETSLRTAGKPWKAPLVLELRGAGRLALSGPTCVGRQWQGNQQFDKQIIAKPPLGLEIVK